MYKFNNNHFSLIHSLRHVVYEASAADGVSHTCGFEDSFTLYEELEIAVYLVIQLKVVCQCVFPQVNFLARSIWVVEGWRQVAQLEVIEMVLGELLSSRSSDAIFWNRDGALYDSIMSIMPFCTVVAHEEGAIRVQMNSVYV
jgi:hypothetical protein